MGGIVGTSHSKSKVIGRSKDTAKAWVNFDGSDGSIRGGTGNSLNISSVTHSSTGLWQINFLQSLPDYYSAAGATNGGTGDSYAGNWGNMDTSASAFYNMTTTSASIAHYKGSYRNTDLITAIFF